MEQIKIEQDKFYTSISEYYPDIFPFNPEQLNFVRKNLGVMEEKRIIDLGCGTGELDLKLAQHGAFVTGIDLNESFIIQATMQNNHENVRFLVIDMLDIENHFEHSTFDAAICFGNTLVHLPGISDIGKLFRSVSRLLKSGGKFLIQILNYDYILETKLNLLPLIENEKVRFERTYLYPENAGFIRFHTELTIKASGKKIVNETSLLPLRSDDLNRLLLENGFSEIEFFADFRMNPFGGSHLPLVATCKTK